VRRRRRRRGRGDKSARPPRRRGGGARDSRGLHGRLHHLEECGSIELVRRPYATGDLAGAFLAIGASGDPATNEQLWAEAEGHGILLNAVDDIAHCHFSAPSVLRRGDLSIAISTGGKAPALAKRLRAQLAQHVGEEYGVLVEALGDVRAEMLPSRDVDLETWAQRWQAALDAPLAERVRRGEAAGVKEHLRRCLAGAAEAPRPGRVAIVGAGPGDPGLITVRGMQLLDEADVVVYDRLVHPSLVEGKEAIFVGKRAARHYVSQDETFGLLVRLARGGKAVVRLKGGDPFVFGRGAEEAEAWRPRESTSRSCPPPPRPSPLSRTPAYRSRTGAARPRSPSRPDTAARMERSTGAALRRRPTPSWCSW
jgi:uroporphyrin-III C-methyltransferase/precorrin-2 dehydrogenase/sirohydrochlorin ferrochelatase